MENLHELPSSVSINPPSFWFWLKAGIGIALGFMLVLPLMWFMMFGLGLGALAAILSGGRLR